MRIVSRRTKRCKRDGGCLVSRLEGKVEVGAVREWEVRCKGDRIERDTGPVLGEDGRGGAVKRDLHTVVREVR